jgi:hypothetical protein
MTKLNSILVVIPSRNRPKALTECLAALIETGGGKGSLMDFMVLSGALSPGDGVVSLFNSVPMQTLERYDVVGMFGDDVRFRTYAWDALVERCLARRPGLLYGRDGCCDERLATQAFVSTRLVLAVGHIYSPRFKSLFADKALMELAVAAGCLQYEPELFTEHMHWSLGKSLKDDQSCKHEKWHDRDQAAMAEWQREDLPRETELVKKALGLK